MSAVTVVMRNRKENLKMNSDDGGGFEIIWKKERKTWTFFWLDLLQNSSCFFSPLLIKCCVGFNLVFNDICEVFFSASLCSDFDIKIHSFITLNIDNELKKIWSTLSPLELSQVLKRVVNWTASDSMRSASNLWPLTLRRSTQTTEGGQTRTRTRRQTGVSAASWTGERFTSWWLCGSWPTSALQGQPSGPWDGLPWDGEDLGDWQVRTLTEYRYDGPNGAGCGTSSFCWRSTLGRTCSTSER